jgi:hypothetical protein
MLQEGVSDHGQPPFRGGSVNPASAWFPGLTAFAGVVIQPSFQLRPAAQTFLNALNNCFGPKSISLSVQVNAVGREV